MKNGMSINSVDNSRNFLKPFFKWLYENEYIKKDIFIKVSPIKRMDTRKESLTDREIVKLRDACRTDLKALALIDFLLSTGVRVSECAALKLSQVDFGTGEVVIFGIKTKEWRKVYLDSNALKHIQDYLDNRKIDSPYVFANSRGGQMSNTSIQSIVKKYGERAGIKKHCTVHLFRKTLATRLYKRGMELSVIAKILGNKNVLTTEKFYLTICDYDIKYLYNKCS